MVANFKNDIQGRLFVHHERVWLFVMWTRCSLIRFVAGLFWRYEVLRGKELLQRSGEYIAFTMMGCK